MKTIKLVIQGYVQGVNFRSTARKKAKSFGILGFIKNKQDGSVYIEAEGSDANIQKFIDWCHVGPEFAKVNMIECEYLKEKRNYHDFVILQ